MDVTRDEITNLFAANVRRRREELGLTQVQLAGRLNMPQGNLSQIETGRRAPNLSTIAELATALEVEPSYLIAQQQLAEI